MFFDIVKPLSLHGTGDLLEYFLVCVYFHRGDDQDTAKNPWIEIGKN